MGSVLNFFVIGRPKMSILKLTTGAQVYTAGLSGSDSQTAGRRRRERSREMGS